jgi:hypothetical protein
MKATHATPDDYRHKEARAVRPDRRRDVIYDWITFAIFIFAQLLAFSGLVI